jgi:two-component system, NarL family, invasion response regulator UvrY
MRRILIIDDHEIVRDGVKRILDQQPGLFTFGEASTAWGALRLMQDETWDIVLLDISLGERDGLELLKEIRKIDPRLPVLILSMHPEDLFGRRALKAGAAGYITKSSPRSELAQAVSKVLSGEIYISTALAERLAIDLTEVSPGPQHEILSNREFEVLRLIASGKNGQRNCQGAEFECRNHQYLPHAHSRQNGHEDEC